MTNETTPKYTVGTKVQIDGFKMVGEIASVKNNGSEPPWYIVHFEDRYEVDPIYPERVIVPVEPELLTIYPDPFRFRKNERVHRVNDDVPNPDTGKIVHQWHTSHGNECKVWFESTGQSLFIREDQLVSKPRHKIKRTTILKGHSYDYTDGQRVFEATKYPPEDGSTPYYIIKDQDNYHEIIGISETLTGVLEIVKRELEV